jgi:hypothetical protein
VANPQATSPPAAFHCFRCRTPLPAGVRACPGCGQAFDAPVPASRTSPPAAAPRRAKPGLWLLGCAGVALVVLAGIGFAGYRAFRSALGGNLARGLQGREAGAGQQGKWTPDAGLTARLDPEHQVGEAPGLYALRPPPGFALRAGTMDAADGKSLIYGWAGPAAPDGTAPQFQVMLGDDGGRMTSRLTSAQDVQLGLMSFRRSHLNFTSSPVQSGLVNGMPFARAYWKGIGARTGRRFHGMVYCQVDSPHMIMISGKDSEPSSRSSLPLFDAAALTLHKM